MIYYKDKDLKKHSISRCIIKKKKKKKRIGVRTTRLSNVIWVFLIYVFVKKYVKKCIMLFKMLKSVFKLSYQIPQKLCNSIITF